MTKPIGDPDMANGLLAEGLSLLQATGQTPSKTNISQWLQAILAMGGLSGVTASAPGSAKTASWSFGGNSYAFNGAATGAGGWIDTAPYPTTAVDISVYRAFNPTTGGWSVVGCLGATSKTKIYSGTPPLPSGYIASQLIHVSVTDSSGNIRKWSQIGHQAFTAPISQASSVNTGGSATSLTLSAVPSAATKWRAHGIPYGSGTLEVSADSSDTGHAGAWSVTGNVVDSALGWIPITTAKTTFYNTGNTATWTINLTGWEF